MMLAVMDALQIHDMIMTTMTVTVTVLLWYKCKC